MNIEENLKLELHTKDDTIISKLIEKIKKWFKK